MRLFEGDEAAAFGGLGLEAGGFCFDFDGLGDFAELEFHALEDDAFGGGENNLVLFVPFEALGRNFEAEGAGEQLREHEVAVSLSGGLTHLIGTDVSDLDRYPCDGATGLIANVARDGAG